MRKITLDEIPALQSTTGERIMMPLSMRLICYNIDLVARSLVKAGKTTSAEIVAAAI